MLFHMPLFVFLSGLVACLGATSPDCSLSKLGRNFMDSFGYCLSLACVLL